MNINQDFINQDFINQDFINLRSTALEGCQQISEYVVNHPEYVENSIPLFSKILVLVADKKSRSLREKAKQTCHHLMTAVTKDGVVKIIQDVIVRDGLSAEAKWRTKVVALELLEYAVEKFPREVEPLMTALILTVAEVMFDTKSQVKDQSATTMKALEAAVRNLKLTRY